MMDILEQDLHREWEEMQTAWLDQDLCMPKVYITGKRLRRRADERKHKGDMKLRKIPVWYRDWDHMLTAQKLALKYGQPEKVRWNKGIRGDTRSSIERKQTIGHVTAQKIMAERPRYLAHCQRQREEALAQSICHQHWLQAQHAWIKAKMALDGFTRMYSARQITEDMSLNTRYAVLEYAEMETRHIERQWYKSLF